MSSPIPVLTGVRYAVEAGVGRITLARPDQANAIDLATARSFGTAVSLACSDPDVRVVLIDAEGRVFCSGGDVTSVVTATDRPAEVRRLADTLDAALLRLDAVAKPVVAAVQGSVAGAGLGVMLACDLVIAARTAKLVTAYTSIGITPDCGVSWLLPRAIGQQRALELVLTGKTLSAEEAQTWGLVTTVVDAGDVGATAQALAETLASSSCFAMGNARRLVRMSWSATRDEASVDEIETVTTAIGLVLGTRR